MQFRIERDILRQVLDRVYRAVSAKADNVALTGVKVTVSGDQAHFIGTTGAKTVEVTVPVADGVDGAVVFPKLFADIVRKLPAGDVTVENEGSDAKVLCGRSKFSVPTQSADDFLKLPPVPQASIKLNGPALTSALAQVVYAAAKQTQSPVLTGIAFEPIEGGMRLIATDSYRLAIVNLHGSSQLNPETVIVQADAIADLSKVVDCTGDVDVAIDQRTIVFSAGAFRLRAQLIEGNYPNVDQILPADPIATLTVTRKDFEQSLDRVRIPLAEGNAVVIDLGTELLLTAHGSDRGSGVEEFDGVYAGKDGAPTTEAVRIGVNPEFFSQALSALGGVSVTMNIVSDKKPVKLTSPDNADALHIIMPVRVSS